MSQTLVRTPATPTTSTQTLLPGLALVAGGVGVALGINRVFPAVSPLMAALVMGALVANLGLARPETSAGLKFSARRLLRAGIVLLGLQLAVPQVLALGRSVLFVVLASVLATFFGTIWLGRRLGLTRKRSLLVAIRLLDLRRRGRCRHGRCDGQR